MKGMFIKKLNLVVGIYPVTNKEWHELLKEEGILDNKPKVDVLPLSIHMFCNTLSYTKKLLNCYKQPNRTDLYNGGYRLLTKEEWEYCASGGGETELYSGTDDIWELSQYASPEYSEVGLLKPNKFGLYDMSGNVDEWVEGNQIKDKEEHMKVTISRNPYSYTNLSRTGFRICRYIPDMRDLEV